MLTLSTQDFTKLVNFVKKNYGINLSEKKILIEGRLSAMIVKKGFSSFSDYVDMLMHDKNGNEISLFLNRITTNHTYFLREMEHFNYMNSIVLPYIKDTVKNKDVRIWSAGCSSGQEAYTMAMVIDEFFGSQKDQWETTILATDISENAMTKGRTGIYTKEELKEMPSHWLTKYFIDRKDNTYQICEKIRKQVVFKHFNLMNPMVYKKPFDLIFCRNVMIYYDAPTKDKLIERFYGALKPGGYFFIGHSEVVNKEHSKFQYIQPAIYRKEKK